MCGLLGYFSKHIPCPSEVFQQSCSLLTHRGPDADGFYFSPDHSLALGHRRLSVLDLRTAANQPMHSADGRYVIVYNGEIYNFRELRKELEAADSGSFATESDTEVILAAWATWGLACLARFNGMFAFALYDKQEEELWLCRDRLGIKPLFVFRQDQQLVFASELKAILPLYHAVAGGKPPLEPAAISAFLHMGFIPQPLTIYKGIEKFPAGHVACFKRNGDWQEKAWWKPEDQFATGSPGSEKEAEDQLHSLLESSVSYRMIADVPFGTFLSGGTDSSLVTAIAAGLAPQSLKTFSIGFKESKFNESHYAAKVAAHLQTDHTEFILSEKEALPLLEEMISTYDEPFGDTSAIPTMLISKLAREKVTVILTGDGGDELFHGYGAYSWASRLASPAVQRLRGAFRMTLLATGSSRYQRIARLFEHEGLQSPRDHIFSQEQYYFSNQELSKIFVNPPAAPFQYHDLPSLPSGMSAAARQAFFDLNVYLEDDLLVKVDRASMKYGLECRVPLLDYRLVAFALNLPDSYKTRGREQKWLLKKLLSRYLPDDLVYRPKWGFSVQLAQWLKGDMKYFLDANLSPEVVRETGLVKPEPVQAMLNSFFRGKTYLYNRLWALALLHKWLKENA